MKEAPGAVATPSATDLSPWWRRSAVLVMATGFAVLAAITVTTYRKAPPIPDKVVDPTGRVLFTGDDVRRGQEVFFKHALMEHGTLWGHGAYLGPDYTARHLHREAEIARDFIATRSYGTRFDDLDREKKIEAQSRLQEILKKNQYDPATRVLTFSAPETESYKVQHNEWSAYFSEGAPGLSPGAIQDPAELEALTAYFAWATWATRANRPGRDYSYTSNWPYEPLVGNRPTADAYLWSALSLLFLLGGLGLVLFAFGRFDFLGWKGGRNAPISHIAPPEKPMPTPSQRVTALFFLVVAALFLLQALVVIGSLGGEYLGTKDLLGKVWFWFGHQGSEYLDLGKFWQILLAGGLVFWLFLVYRSLKPAFARREIRELSGLFLVAAGGIVFFYLPAFLYGARTNFAVIDNWRFWIIHLWVEGFFELFATVVVALMFTNMGVVSAKTAVRVVYLDAILYLAGGIVGTAHHWYFTGEESITMILGASFSAMEVIPLTLLTLDAWDFIKLQKTECPDCGRKMTEGQKWAIYFLMAVGVWNFVGAGVFGFLINLPIVSYFEMGTTLTANHGHAAMFGVFGMLGLAVLVFCLRAMLSDRRWTGVEKYFKFGFWGVNIGLALMVVLNLFPAGVVQLYDVVKHGYAHARSTEFTMHGFFHASEWVRIIGDMTFLLAGALPIALGTLVAVTRIGKEKGGVRASVSKER